MSTGAEVSKLWEDVRNDNNPLRWVIARVNEKSTDLEVVASNSTGYADFVKKLGETKGVVHGGIRISAVDERGSVKSIRYKFLRVSMMTDDVPQLKRAKAGQLNSEIQKIFDGAHVAFDISNITELDQDAIVQRLQSAAGAHKPNRYDFEGLEELHTPKQPECGLSPRKVPVPVPAPAPAPAPAPEPAPEPAPKEDLTIAQAWERVHDDKSPINYVLVTFDGKDVKTATLLSYGTGSLADFKAQFEDDKPIYAGFRLRAIDDRGSVMSVRAKIIFVSFIGKSVKPTVRAQAGAVKGEFERLLSGTHLPVHFSDISELTEEDIVHRLQSSAGAHKPNRYDFSGKKGQDE
jgi:hypothetical protein